MTNEVVVMGCGPTGILPGCELWLAGVETIVLEGLSHPTGLSKALGLQARTIEMLDHRGSAAVLSHPFPKLRDVSIGFTHSLSSPARVGHSSGSPGRYCSGMPTAPIVLGTREASC
jgi:2-polyprenyl-6-methoxyphenol hydroxylase-like FAD-dependent oxidoreductase